MARENETLKRIVCAEVDRIGEELVAASDHLAHNPELGYQEFKSVASLRELLAKHGIAGETGIAGMPTALRAELPGGNPKPRIAILAEYDALPEIGHGCGHNIIGTSAVGAAIALHRVSGYLDGSAVLFGTPCEESTAPGAGGKVPMVVAGLFDDVDAAIMMHPGTQNLVAMQSSLAARGFDFEFTGRAAHAAARPYEGINALDAVILTFNGINALRQHVKPDVRIHGIITRGGGAANVVPAFASCRIRVRSESATYLDEVVQRVIRCAEGAALMSGATLQWREYANPYANFIPNKVLNDVARANLEKLGLAVDEEPYEPGMGSTDLGNVSFKTPAMYFRLAISTDKEVRGHSAEFAAATLTPQGHHALLNAAKALAMTAIDLIADPQALKTAREEWMRALDQRK